MSMRRKAVTVEIEYFALRSLEAHVRRTSLSVEEFIASVMEEKAAELKAERSASWKAARLRNLTRAEK